MFHSKQDVDRHVSEVFRNIKSEYQRNSKCYQIAKLYYKFKDYKSAIKYINRYILTTTNSAAAHRLLGECYLGINSKVKAIDSFKTSLELNGSQNELVLKICSLLMDPDVSTATPRATYWLERAEALFPTNPIVFQLREHLLKSNLDGKQDNGQLEKLILSEISARPADVTVRIRLLNFFVETKRFQIAYQHALDIEERKTFSNDLRWYDCLCNVVQAYEKANNGLGFSFFIKKIIFFEKRADLSMQEFQEEVKTLPECSSALFAFDQSLHSVSKIEVNQEDTYFFTEFMKHMRAQLSFHLATLALKRAKKEFGIWPKAFRTASPLLLQASQNTMDLEEAWYNMWSGRNKMAREVEQLNKSATFRISQAGHVLLAWSQSKGSKFLEKVAQFCGGKWQNHVYQDVFYNREHQQAISTSHFVNDPFFANVPMRLLTESELNHYDEASQSAYPDSLHHLVWLGLAYCNVNGSLSHDFRCTTVSDLQFTVTNLSQTGPETLNQLDVDAFLYASVLCAKSTIPTIASSDRPSRLPVSISEELCSPAQAEWWVAVYKTYTNQTIENLAETRLKLKKGIEVIRVYGQHGLHVKIIVALAKLFQERATKNKNPNELTGLESRAYLYWSAAIPLLEKIEKNQQLRDVPNRLFDYRGKDLSPSEVKSHLEDGRLFLACRLMKQGRHEQAIEAFQPLKSPYATFYQALIYEKLASEEVNHRPESITSENRSQHIILLTRARDAMYLTLDRLRAPGVDPNHPLNAQLHDHLDQIEKQLTMIDPDSNLNRNGDSQSDETDTAPGPLSPEVDENLDSSFNVYNTSHFLGVKNHSTSRTLRQNLSERHHHARFEARPSPERLDAQLRHLVQSNSTGLQAIVEQLKEVKSIIQIELKDLGCVTRDLLAEMKRWNDRLQAASKRVPDDLKPEDLFELRDEDYEDLSQLSQPCAPYHNYQLNSQITGTQGTSTLTYGGPVPSPIPPVPPAIPASEIPPGFCPGAHSVPTGPPVVPSTEIPLIPPVFCGTAHAVPAAPAAVPNPESPYFYSAAHSVSSISPLISPYLYSGPSVHARDPSLMFLRPMRYCAPRMPYGENQTMPDFVGAGYEKGISLPKTSSVKGPDSVPVTTVASSKPQPPNVVITSSDTLPAFTNAGTPVMSVTVPPQHIRGLAPSTVGQKFSPGQVHPFQIQMPPQAQTVKESPTQKLNSLTPTTFSTGTGQRALVSGVKPTPVEQTTPLKDLGQSKLVTQVNKTSEGKSEGSSILFESRGTLWIFEDDWKERGSALIKILHDVKLGTVRIIIGSSFLTYADHYITPDLNLEDFPEKKHGWCWSASNLHKPGAKPESGTGFKALTWQKYGVKFESEDESKDFEFAFNEGRRLGKEITANGQKGTPTKEGKGKECARCKAPVTGNQEKCFACENKEKENPKTELGGFTFMSSPIVKPPVLKLGEPAEKPKEKPKASPFTEFSFLTPATTTGTTTTTTTTTTTSSLFGGLNKDGGSINWFAGVKGDPNSFKKDANFKGFGGKDSLVFGYLNKPKTDPKSQKGTPKSGKNEDEENGDEEFEPTAEFTPVVALPDLVDVKTGEENDKVLYDERAKLLRFDKNLKEWKERGVGNMKLLLNEESGKVRLIMRRDLVLKVCCNHYLDEKMEFKRMTKSEKALTWCCQDYSEGEIKSELFALKFADPDSMVRFEKAVKKAQTDMQSGGGTETKPKETREEKPKELKPLSELFKPKAGSWECGSCLLRNEEIAKKCVSCETPKPGTEAEAKEPKTEGLGVGIKFPPTTMSFTFGIPSTGGTTTVPTSGTQFGFQLPQTTTSSTGGFKFGATSGAKTESSSPATAPTVKYSFGIPPATTTATSDSSSTTKLLWTAAPAVSNSATLFSSKTGGTPAPAFSSGNIGTGWQLGSKTSTTSSTSFSSPSFTFSIANTKPDGTNIFGSKSVSFTTPKAEEEKQKQKTPGSSEPAFGLLSTLKPGEKEKFEFTPRNLKPVIVESPKKKSGGDGATSGESEGEGDDADDSGDHIIVKPIVPLPDKVALHTGEEDEDVLYEKRAKLYRFIDKEWKERGLGDIKILKHKTNNKIRLLMRRETILKVCLNHYLTPDIELSQKDEKTWTWRAADFSEGEVRFDLFAIRFKNPEIAQEFKKAVEDAKNNVTPTVKPTTEVKSEKAKEPSAAMKNFTFAVGEEARSRPPNGSRSTASEDADIVVVYEAQVTPEQREKAMSLQLPPNFYAYMQGPGCPGCVGCEKDDGTEQTTQETEAPDSTNKPIFGTSSWGKLDFESETNFEEKVRFSFPVNQGPIKWNPATFAPKATQEADNEEEYGEEEENYEEDEEEEEEYEEGDEDEEDWRNLEEEEDWRNVEDDEEDEEEGEND